MGNAPPPTTTTTTTESHLLSLPLELRKTVIRPFRPPLARLALRRTCRALYAEDRHYTSHAEWSDEPDLALRDFMLQWLDASGDLADTVRVASDVTRTANGTRLDVSHHINVVPVRSCRCMATTDLIVDCLPGGLGTWHLNAYWYRLCDLHQSALDVIVDFEFPSLRSLCDYGFRPFFFAVPSARHCDLPGANYWTDIHAAREVKELIRRAHCIELVVPSLDREARDLALLATKQHLLHGSYVYPATIIIMPTSVRVNNSYLYPTDILLRLVLNGTSLEVLGINTVPTGWRL